LFGIGTTTGQSTSGGGLFGGGQAKLAGGGLFGSTTTTPTNTNNLFGGGQQQQSNLFGSTTTTNPLLGGKNLFGGSTLGTSTFGSGQQPQQQQLTANFHLGRLEGWDSSRMILQANMLISLLGLKGYIMRETLLRYPFFVGCFFDRYGTEGLDSKTFTISWI